VIQTSERPVVVGGDRFRRASSWWWGYTTVLVGLDTLAIVAGILVGQLLRFGDLNTVDSLPQHMSYTTFANALIPAWLATMALCGTYGRRHLEVGTEEYRRVFSAALRFVGVLATFALVFKIDVARGFIAVAVPVATVTSLGGRYAARHWLHRRRSRLGSCMKRTLVVGSNESAAILVRALHDAPFVGYGSIAACTPQGNGTIEVDGRTISVVASTDGVLDAAYRTGADAIVVADGAMPDDGLPALAWQIEGTGIELLVAPAATDVAGPRITIRPVEGLPLMYVEEPELSGIRRLAKSIFDRTIAAVWLIVLVPVLVAIGMAVRLTSRGPALFRQVRVGLGGRHFVLWKFRTMTVDAEERLADLLHLNEHDGVLFKIADDPRTTRLGRVLRRWSVDELPQLWNVLRGDMSIVGPRPPLPNEVERYDDNVKRRLLVKPGLTGLWQVSGRAQLPWDEAVRLDLYYIENWSPALDAVILAKTFAAVLRRHGAC